MTFPGLHLATDDRPRFGEAIAWEQDGQLAMEMVGESTTMPYSGSMGFSTSGVGGYWNDGPGPGDSTFYYGPTPDSAGYATLTAPGYQPVVVRTMSLPRRRGFPCGSPRARRGPAKDFSLPCVHPCGVMPCLMPAGWIFTWCPALTAGANAGVGGRRYLDGG